MAKPKKDGQFLNIYLDRELHQRLCVYAELKGQTKTLAIERILKEAFDKEKISAPSENKINNR